MVFSLKKFFVEKWFIRLKREVPINPTSKPVSVVASVKFSSCSWENAGNELEDVLLAALISNSKMTSVRVNTFYSCIFCRTLLYFAIIFLVLFFHRPFTECSHISGSWNSSDFFKFLVKFGFQKTIRHNQKESLGYIFGNITSKSYINHTITLSVLDRGYFLEYYGNRSILDKDLACARMFNKISTTAFDSTCYDQGEDFLRKVPCPKGKLCEDEDVPWNVVKGYQFTYAVQDLRQPRFWYVSLVACYRDLKTCKWHHLKENINLDYDIWLVNGNPNVSTYNPLVYQFSFDRQNTLEMYLVFFLWYTVLVPVQVYASTRQSHPVTRLFTASLLLEFLAFCFILVHVLKFALDGVGLSNLALAGDILDILSRTTFMLLLLLLAKGWAVTRMELTWKPLVFSIWFIYGVVHILLYVWNMTEVDIIEDIDEYQTWPGWLILTLRTSIMIWFLFELKNTMTYEHNTQKLNFFLHFGASSLVWFIYLPIVALIALHISSLWRFKFLLGITYSADCLAYSVMTHLLWPARSEQYFLLADEINTFGDELDEFSEAPHEIHNSYTSLQQHGSNGDLSDYSKAVKT